MTSKTSFFNKTVLRDDMRRFYIIGILYTLILHLLLPVYILMEAGKDIVFEDKIQRLLAYTHMDSPFLILTIIAVPILLSVFLFKYMQSKASADFVHSLPIKRNTMYRTHVLAGVLLIALPVLLTTATLQLVNTAMGLGSYYSFTDIITWAGVTLLLQLVMFFVGNAVGMICGMSAVQGVITAILLVLPMALMELIDSNMAALIYGFETNMSESFTYLSPITRLAGGFFVYPNRDLGMKLGEVLIYAAICIILLIISELLYNIRKTEGAAQPIVHKRLHAFFRLGVSICAMLLAGGLLNQGQGSKTVLYLGYFIGSLVGYFAAEMLMKKTWRVLSSIKGYGILALAVIAAVTLINADVVGYERRMPGLESIDSVYLREDFYIQPEGVGAYSYTGENLQKIFDMHKQIIKDKASNESNKDRSNEDELYIVYNLKNGKTIRRGYYLDKKRYAAYLKPVYESYEHKLLNYGIVRVNPETIEKLVFEPYGMHKSSKPVSITEPSHIKEAVDILKQEIITASYEDMNYKRAPWASIKVAVARPHDKEYADGSLYTTWNKSYLKLEKWLKEKGYCESLILYPKDVATVAVKLKKGNNGLSFSSVELDSSSVIKITDKAEIEQCIQNYTDRWYGKNVQYQVVFLDESHEVIAMGAFHNDYVPDFVKKYFEK